MSTCRSNPASRRDWLSARLEGVWHAGREDGTTVGSRRASRPRRALAEAERARDHAARRVGRDGGARRATSAVFGLSHPPPARTAMAVVAKGAPRLPRLGFPPWTPPSEAPPPEKESPGGGTHPPTRS